MDVLPLLSWHLAGGFLALVLLGLALRRYGGGAVARVGAVLVWLAVIATAAWAGASLYDGLMILYR
ncbi:hypothetical protein [Neoroseomonas oryzicola]|uniref:Uncharacterized protein n=1 Tax=Neoroseomonas oryzicola TaxID=535904 RepID=A0A9X9WEQ3_9PROT|nr:hypothetical protein [Neoroseomonas oryzicola]MBR0658813.1 hypothetical protein [Neoroseomonas oryzicola]NKE17291.1 hypothetical protein [Neoroseomonas oryzicola]